MDNFEEYIEHRELIVCGFEKLSAKHANKRTSRGAAAVAKGTVNAAGGAAAVTATGATVVATNAAATAAATSCAVTAASATSTAVAAAATASAAAIAAPVVLGVGMAMGIGIFAGKYFTDRADEAEFSRLQRCLQKLEEMDELVNEKIVNIQKSAAVQKKGSGASFEAAMTPWNAWQATDAAVQMKGEVEEGFVALNSLKDGHCSTSDVELVYKAVGDGSVLAAEGTSAAVAVAGGLGIFGVVGGIWDITAGAREIRSQSDFERKFAQYVEALQAQCRLIRQHEASLCCKGTKRGRLTYINGGGGCARQMLVSYYTAEGEKVGIDSDSSHVITFPKGAHDVRVRFSVTGGSMAWKVDRRHSKQPWTEPRTVEMIAIPKADGINVVFELRGTSQHSFVHKAWDFSKSDTCHSPQEHWEWCGNEQDQECLLVSAKDSWIRCVHEWITVGQGPQQGPSLCNKRTKRGRLTYVNGGGGCARQMLVSYSSTENEKVDVISDSSHVVILPEGARDVRIRFKVIGGTTAWKIDRHNSKQPWKRPSEEEEIHIPRAEGVDVVFELRGTSLHSYVHKAWNFGITESPRHDWEWCGDEQGEECLFSCAKDFWM